VGLYGENRAIAAAGLRLLNGDKYLNYGFSALIQERGLSGKLVRVYDVGFVIGPCINATGRLDDAALAVELLTCEDAQRVTELVGVLIGLNDERKRISASAVDECLNNYPEELNRKICVIYNENIHESIAGIVAGRLKEATGKPTIVLTKGTGCVKGSARSISQYNIFEALSKNAELFLRFGGHPQAAGLSLEYDNVAILRERLNEQCGLSDEDFELVLDLDEILQLNEANLDLAYELTRLNPFGKGNREPLFASYGVKLSDIRVIEAKNTVIFSVSDGQGSCRCVMFGRAADFSADIRGRVLRELAADIAYTVEVNTYNGFDTVNLKIKDYHIHKGA
jgi:single-stranded-DNA-specific exonuclease